jgi:hypothetical protein
MRTRQPDPLDTIVHIHRLWMTSLAQEHSVPAEEEREFEELTAGHPGVEGAAHPGRSQSTDRRE